MQECEYLLESINSKYELKRIIRQKIRNEELKVANKATKYKVAARIYCKYGVVAYLHQYSAFLAFFYINISKLF